MKLNSFVSKFLTNKWVLNVVAILALFNIIGYVVIGNFNAILHFIVIAVLIRYFSKNMTFILGVPLIIVNLLAMRGNMLEGMTTESAGTNSTTPKNENAQDKINKLVKNQNKLNPKSGQGLAMQPLEQDETASDNAAQSNDGEQEGKAGFESGRRKNRGYDIDYATTIEDAYDQLNNILGSDGISRLTNDTQNLMKQQMQLAESMKSMEPMINSLGPMMKNLESMMGNNNLGDMMGLAKKFGGQQAPTNK